MAAAQPVNVSSSSGGGWRALIWIALAAIGVGFAGYVFLAPYQKMKSALTERSTELGAQRAAVDEVSAERDKLKAEVAGYVAAADQRAVLESKRKASIQAVAGSLAQVNSALAELGASVAPGAQAIDISFQVAKVIDRNGIDVSDAGAAALQLVAGAVKKAGAHVAIKVRASAAPPPRELKSLFRTAGEMHAVRAARIMSALENAGLLPDQVSIVGVGQADKVPPPRGRGRKAPPGPPERLEIQVEPG